MTERILDIDHLMVSAAGAQGAGDQFERLGFTLTPRSELPGMSNRLICFEPPASDRCNFIEFLSLDDPQRAPAIMSDILLPAQRPVSMVMVSRDVRATTARLRSQGLEADEPLALKRDWVLPGGEVISPEFVVSIPKFGQAPLYWNVVQYVNPELYRRPEFVRHANSAVAFAGVIAVASDPGSVADHFSRMWAAARDDHADGRVTIRLDHVWLQLLPPSLVEADYPGVDADLSGRAARYLGFQVTVADLHTLKASLEDCDRSVVAEGGSRVWVPPEAAHGCVVEFREAALT